METIIKKISLEEDDGDLINTNELKKQIKKLPSEIGIRLINDNEVELTICCESGEGLWLDSEGEYSMMMFWFSYETKNLYCGSPISGAIYIGNLKEATGLSPQQTDRFAEFLSCMPLTSQDFSEFKLENNTNLLNALLSPNTDCRTENLEDVFYELNDILGMVYDISDMLLSCSSDNTQVEVLKKLFAWGTPPYEKENVLTLAQRYPGLVTFEGDKWEFDEEGSAYMRNLYGIDFGGMIHTIWQKWDNRMEPDAFIKRCQMLHNWCKDIR